MQTGKMVSTFRERLTLLCERAKQAEGKHVKQSDEEIAKGIGVSKQTVSAWRCGDRSPKQPAIEATARYFGVNIDWLMGFDVSEKSNIENKKPIPENELNKELVSLLADLTPQEISRVADFVSGLKASRAEVASLRKKGQK